MRKGVVIKSNNDRAILITEDCTFCEIKAFNGMYKGMEVCFNDMDILKRKIAFRTNKYVNAACFMLLVFCSYLILSFYQENIAAYAYVGIDINPSIEIALNKKGQIINARGLNKEGKELLGEIDIMKMDSVEGIKQIIAKTIDMNFFELEDNNEITVYAIMERENNKGGNELILKMENAIKEEVAAHSIKGEIKTIVSDKKVKDKADKAGLSVAQYISKDAKAAIAEDKEDKATKEAKDKDDKEEEKDKESKNGKANNGKNGNNDDKDNNNNNEDKDNNRNNRNKGNKGNNGNKDNKDDKDKVNDNKDDEDKKGNSKVEQENKSDNENNGKPKK